jgi:hypothetical protein
VMERIRLISASSSTPAILGRGRAARPRAPRTGYSSGTKVGVALVRVSFLKNAGAVVRQ